MNFDTSKATDLAHKASLPALRARVNDALPASRRERLAPMLFAGGLLAIGAALLKAKPRIGHVPEPRQFGDLPRRSKARRAALTSRDHVAAFAPTNVTDSLGRSLMIGGAALLLTRLLDEAAGRDGK
ncbi:MULTISPECIES: hypothetical protein [Roseobacteraceae]|uniref:hypothetical protein n=1 Tax=Roseobacteraceae TaxID=2854170 RepID=UPI00080AC126|nr:MULTISPECIES: hypothetical protein [Roseobacteraceae]ANT62151.1 hypothetical protein AYJ57_17115 [Salipiger sp. CCB-MM3]MCA0997054.1 hypothetical protein [Alloyangia pacifica]